MLSAAGVFGPEIRKMNVRQGDTKRQNWDTGLAIGAQPNGYAGQPV
jgi:hypothetical protein